MTIFRKKIFAISAMIAGFAMYVFCFEPFGIAECAYVFAVPIILACRAVFHKDDDKIEKSTNRNSPNKLKWKFWLCSSFLLSYIAWVAILAWIRHVYPPAGWIALAVLPLIISTIFIFPWFAILPKFLPKLTESWVKRLSKLLGIAGIWVILEWVRTWLFSGFGWLLLADSQWRRPASIQLSEYGGVWIVSFILIFSNLAIAEYIYRYIKISKNKLQIRLYDKAHIQKISRFAPEFYIALLLIFGGAWVYIAKLPTKENETHAFRAGFVQTDFAGILKWDESLADENFRTIIALTNGLKLAKADIALWPEAATPPNMPIIGYTPTRILIEALSKRTNIPILMGNMAYFADENPPYCQNCAFFVSPNNGLEKEFYAKQKLVPFGEYTPSWLSFLGKIVPVGMLKAGETSKPLLGEIAGKKYKIGAMICYEDIFPSLGRKLVNEGAEILFVCTNDSWYGREGGAWQHASHSALQAAATRCVLLRSSNNGLSAVFDQYGRMRPTFALKSSDGLTWQGKGEPESVAEIEIRNENGELLDPDTLSPSRPQPLVDSNGSIYFRGAGFADVVFYKNFSEKSLYVKWGDWFVALCAIFALTPVLLNRKKRMRRHL